MKVTIDTESSQFFPQFEKLQAVAARLRDYNRLKHTIEEQYEAAVSHALLAKQQGLDRLRDMQRNNPEIVFEIIPSPKRGFGWSQERREAQAARMRAAWGAGTFTK